MLSTPYIFNELYDIFWRAPLYVIGLQVVLVFTIIWLVFHKSKFNGKRLTPEEKVKLLEQYTPEPLVGDVPEDHPTLTPRMITGRVGKRITVNGIDCLNLSSHNYLGLLGDKQIEDRAIESVRKYGVGSCGPRGFYGTLEVHLELEERLAKFMKCEEACVYSYGFSTIASAIPSYCKRGDLVFVDERVHFAIQRGLDASRSKIFYFKHNDAKDLERLLEEQHKLDLKNPKKAAKTRRFLIAEAIYMNTGEMCPLPQLVKLRQQYKLRFILDESISFGTLGKNGRGLTEFLNVERKEIDLICGSLEWAVGAIGGFCVGTTYIVDHQRLSGLGYCFSASAPPLLTQAAISSLDRFEREPEMFEQINKRCEKVHQKFSEFTRLSVAGHPLSPVKHLTINGIEDNTTELELINAIAEACIKEGLAITNAEHLEKIERYCPRSSIRIAVSRLLTDDDINFAFDIMERISVDILKNFVEFGGITK